VEKKFVTQQFLALPFALAAVSFAACAMPTEEETSTTESAASGKKPPPAAAVAHANDVADAMVDRIVTLLFREFEVTTPENAEVGSDAISNIFFDANYTMRLVGDVDPLQDNNRPRDDFEEDALAAAKTGANFSRTERVSGRWWVRKSIAVATTFSPACVHCHPNFDDLANPWVGALMVRAKVDD
jgi:hypothetical protein